MANEKMLNTRILLKYDTLENWNNSEGILRAGEVAIATVKVQSTEAAKTAQNEILASGNLNNEGVVVPPDQVLVKVGDGKSTFKQLPYITAKAGDVYGWAKEASLQYAHLPEKLRNAITDYEERIGALEGFKNNEVATAIETAITTALEELTVVDVAGGKVVTKVVQNNGKIEVTKGDLKIEDLTDGTALKEEVANLKTTAESYATKTELNTAKSELSGEIDSDIAAARGLISAEIDGDIATAKTELVGDVNTENTILWVKKAADDAATAANSANENANTRVLTTTYNSEQKAQDDRLTALEGKIGGVTGAMHFKGVVTTDPTAEGFNVSGYAAGDVVIFGNKEYVFNNGAFVELGDTTAELQAIEDLQTAVKAIEDAPYATEGYVGEAVADAKEELIGASTDSAEKNTIYGAKAAAAAVLGTSADDAGAATVHGALKAAAAADEKAGNAATAAATADGKAVKAQEEVDALELVVGTKADGADKETVFGAIAKAQGEVDALELVVGDAADTKDDATVYGAIAAEKARALEAEKNLSTNLTDLGKKLTTVSTTRNQGLKVTPTENADGAKDYKVDIDDAVTFVFNCGTSANLDPAQA